MLQGYVRTFQPDAVWLVSDPNIPEKKRNWRQNIHADYKARHKTRDEEGEKRYSAIQRQMPLLKEYALKMNVWWMEQDHLEADDILGWLKWNYRETCFVCISTDKDLFTLLDTNFSVYYPGQKRKVHLTVENFEFESASFLGQTNKKRADKDKLRFTVPQWMEFRYLDGDDSDMLEGLPGCGPVLAHKVIHHYGGYPKFLEDIKTQKKPGKKELGIATPEAQKLYERNKLLMCLRPPPIDYVLFDMTNERCALGQADFPTLKQWMLGMNFADKEAGLISKLEGSPLLFHGQNQYEPLRKW